MRRNQQLWQRLSIDDLLLDLRYSLRLLAKSPGFAAVALLTIALGIGANTLMFSVVQGVLLSPLPYSAPNRLVMVWEKNPRFPRVWSSYPNFRDWQRTSRAFRQMAAGRDHGVDLTSPGAPEHLNAQAVSAGFFDMLGLKLTLGREFSPQEDQPGGNPVALISQRLWRTRFAATSGVLGQPITVDGVDYTIIGIVPTGFNLQPQNADVFTPLGQADPLILNDRAAHDGIFVIARLEDGVTLFQSQTEMTATQNGLDQLYPDANRDLGVFLEPLKQVIVGDVSSILVLLFGAVGLVLLIAAANVANLLLSRSAARSREFAIRSAIGADRARLARQLLTESLLLSLIGASVGLLMAILGVRPVLAAIPGTLPRVEDVRINGWVLLFTVLASVVIGILFGLAPALKTRNINLPASLKAGGRGATRRQRVQSSLVIVQMALTLVLLAGAGLLFRTIQRLSNVNPGFDAQHLITFRVGVSASRMKTASAARATYHELIDRIRQIPGVTAADFTGAVPLTGQAGSMPFWINSQKPSSLQAAPRVVMSLVGPDYIRTMGIPLLRGRFFTSQDTINSPCVMVINSVLAHAYFPGSDPLEQTLSAGYSPVGPCRIIGVVGHVNEWQLDEPNTVPQNQVYFPLYQDPDKWVLVNYPYISIVVRTPLDLATLMPTIKSAVQALSSDQPVYEARTMRQIVSESMSSQRFPMIFLTAFAVLALTLACIGTYGVISYSVAQRIQEIGVRMALGAEKGTILRMVLGHGLRLAAAGLAIGAAASLILARLLPSFSQLLNGVGASDPATFVAVSAVLIGVAALACYIPARRAMRVDPIVALRYE